MRKTALHETPSTAISSGDAVLESEESMGQRRWRESYQVLWPILALLLVEVLAIAFLAPSRTSEMPIESLALALAVLPIGLVPAFLRPSPATSIVGCSAVVLAGVIWWEGYTLLNVPAFDEFALALENNEVRLGLLNMVLLAPLTLHLVARFPERRSMDGRILASYYAFIIGITLLLFVLSVPLRQVMLIVLLIALYAGFGVAGYQLLRTIRSTRPTYPRSVQQARLLLLILILAEAPLLLLPLGSYISLFIPYQVITSAQILLPIGVAYIILRQDLFGIDAAMRRALDYGLVSFGLLVIYFGLTAFLTQLSSNVSGTWGFAATILSVVAAAAAFTPLRKMAQRLIDQVFYPERLRFTQTISMARTTLARVVQRESVIRLLTDELPQQLGAAWAELVLRPSFHQPDTATQSGFWNTLMTVGGQPIGHYWLGPRSSGLRYAADEQEQLQGLLQQAALALAYADTFDNLAQLNDELEERVAIRTEHVVAQQRELAAFEERQRLARDLHDSIKQALFSIGIGIRTARNRVHNDPDATVLLLQQHEQTAIEAQSELGDMLSHLRTPATNTTDLVVLLTQHVTWFTQQHGMDITYELPPALILQEPLPRELAQLTREAFHNTFRHSGTTAVHLTLSVEQGQLILSITDHGCGFDSSSSFQGQGLRNMRERVALLGGTLQIYSEQGKGVTIWAKIDLER
ncbi:MAG: sensor histidine kinase [Chloroflexota bacterium]